MPEQFYAFIRLRDKSVENSGIHSGIFQEDYIGPFNKNDLAKNALSLLKDYISVDWTKNKGCYIESGIDDKPNFILEPNRKPILPNDFVQKVKSYLANHLDEPLTPPLEETLKNLERNL